MKYLILILALTASAFGQQLKSPGVNGENIVNPAFRNAVLPSQSTHSGKYLKTNGTGASWETATSDLTSGPVTSSAEVSTIANGAITNAMLANGAVANLSGTNTGNETADTLAAAMSSSESDKRAIRDSVNLGFNEGLLNNYRTALLTKRPSVLFFGDSMIGTASTMVSAFTTRITTGGAGEGLLPAALAGGATSETDACLKWITGSTFRLSSAGHTATFGGAATFSVAGDTLKIYYLRQPGGGIFKIQSDMNDANTFPDEAGQTSIDTNGAIAGMVVTIAKSNYRQKWRIRCSWVSANAQVTGALGAVNIIGAGVRDSRSTEGLVTSITNGSTAVPDNNISAAYLTPRAITDPILADIAPNLVIMSHLDGAGTVNTAQGTFQNNLNAGIVSAGGLAASWLVISSPAGPTPEIDAANKAQMEAQRGLARTRGDAFFDNHSWMGGSANALSKGYLLNAGDVHPTVKAQTITASMVVRDTGLMQSLNRNERITPFLEIVGGGKFHGYVDGATENTSFQTYHEGSLRLTAAPGSISTGPLLVLEPYNALPANSNDGSTIKYSSSTGTLDFGSISQPMWSMRQNVGPGAWLAQPNSTAAAPDGVIGTLTLPLREINMGKTINTSATTGNVTIDKVTGRVWFAAAAQTLTVTNARCTTNSIIMATVLGNDTTAKTVRVETVLAGSFVLTLDAAATGLTAVNFWVMP